VELLGEVSRRYIARHLVVLHPLGRADQREVGRRLVLLLLLRP
jgi:hypothetical protein